MISQLIKTTSRISLMHAGIATAFVCALGATDANARILSPDGFENQLGQMLVPTAERQLSQETMLAQYADDCACDDVEDFDEEYSEDYDEDFAEDFEEDYDEDYAEDFELDSGDGYTGDYGSESASSQGLTAEQQARLNRVTDRVLRIRERAIDIQIQGGYDYYGPAQ